MKLYFETEYVLKVVGTTCIIRREKVQLQEIDLAIPKNVLTVLKTLPADTELEVTMTPATLYHSNDLGKMVKRDTDS